MPTSIIQWTVKSRIFDSNLHFTSMKPKLRSHICMYKTIFICFTHCLLLPLVLLPAELLSYLPELTRVCHPIKFYCVAEYSSASQHKVLEVIIWNIWCTPPIWYFMSLWDLFWAPNYRLETKSHTKRLHLIKVDIPHYCKSHVACVFTSYKIWKYPLKYPWQKLILCFKNNKSK